MKKIGIIFLGCLLVMSGTWAAPKSENDKTKKSRFEKLELFNKVLYLVESQYYKDVDTEKLIQGAIKGMMDTLDPHSTFLEKDFFAKMQEDTAGEFGGIGIEVTMKDGLIVIIAPIDDTPAHKAGIRPGDRIVEINNESVIGITLDQAVEKMKGKSNTKLSIGITRDGVDGIKHYEIMREIIKIEPVKSAILDNNYIFLRLTQFQKRSAQSLEEHMKKLKEKTAKQGGAKGIILDLRSNPGGLLDEAVDVASLFLKDGIVVSTEERAGKNKEIRYVKKSGYKELNLPMLVLINGSSASASEIVAGALQDNGRAIIMGNQSFGKGTVQTVAKVDESSGVKLTIAQYMTPSGKKIQAIGIRPDIEFDEFDARWAKDNRKDKNVIREIDLRNHLTASIETEQEKQARLEKEKEERDIRLRQIEEKKSNKEKADTLADSEEQLFKKYVPTEDFQVIQAVNYLKSMDVLKKMSQKF